MKKENKNTTKGSKAMTIEEKKAKELEKAERLAQKKALFDDSHLYFVWTEELTTKKGESFIRENKDCATGSFTEKCVYINTDPLLYTTICDNLEGGLYIKQSCRTKETSKSFYRKSSEAKAVRATSNEFTLKFVDGMDFPTLLAKVKHCKGFKETTNARLLEVMDITVMKATNLHKSHLNALEKKNAKESAKVSA